MSSTPTSTSSSINLDSTDPAKTKAWTESNIPLRPPVAADENPRPSNINSMRRAAKEALKKQNAEAEADMAQYRQAIKKRKVREREERRAQRALDECGGEVEDLEGRETKGIVVIANQVIGLDGEANRTEGYHKAAGGIKGAEVAQPESEKVAKRGWKGWALVSEDESDHSKNDGEEERNGQELGRGKRRRSRV